MANNFVKALIFHPYVRQVHGGRQIRAFSRSSSKYRGFTALCICGGFLYKHSLFRRRNARSSGDEEGSAEHQNLYAVAGALCFFCTKATSGIMRRRRLMCESRVCPHPKGFADSKRGKHVRKGDIFSRGILHLMYKKKATRLSGFALIKSFFESFSKL